jgi:hypothetical protein
MLESVLSAVIGVFNDSGICAARAYTGHEINRDAGPRVHIGIKKGLSESAGFGGYLGTRLDPERGEVELFGYKLDVTIELMLCAPESGGAAAAEALYSQIAEAVCGLPSGIKQKRLALKGGEADLKTGMFKCEAELDCTVHFVFTVSQEDTEFLDFEIKGVVKNAI